MRIPAPPWWFIPVLIALCAAIRLSPPARSEISNEWLELLAAIERKPCEYKENHDDELFIRRMINLLTLDNPPEPSPSEKKWILTLKKECKL